MERTGLIISWKERGVLQRWTALYCGDEKSISGRLSRFGEIIKERGFEIYSDEERGDFTFIEARKF